MKNSYQRPANAAWKRAEKGEYKAIKCHNTAGDNHSGFYEIYYGVGTPEDWFVWKDKHFKTLGDHSIGAELQRYQFTKILLTGDGKVIISQAALDLSIHAVGNFNKIHIEIMTHE